ncbi:MAG: cell division protein ZapA [bacterium]
MGEDSDRITTVRIFNQTYNVRSDNEPAYIQKLAALLDNRMAEISQLTPTVDTVRVAVLAALNIADEYFLAQSRLEALEHEVDEKGGQMIATLKPLCDQDSP